MAVPLLATKLYVPPARSEWVSRPRLIERLNAGLPRKLTLLSAPAGFGKTTLLSEWIHGQTRGTDRGTVETGPTPHSLLPTPSFAWLSLDENDSDPTRFLVYLIAALQTIPDIKEGGFGIDTLAMLQSPQPPPREAILVSLINDITSLPSSNRSPDSCPLVLVLDDYQLVQSQQIDDALVFVLDHLPLQMHLVIATRKDPLLPLARLRVGGEMTEIRASDLRFTPDEATAFLNQAMQLGLLPEQVAALETRTEGWIAGLHLAALSLRGRSDRGTFIRAFAGDDRHVMDYLVNEVLSRQPETVQRFLLHTAILERLSGPLCDAVIGGDDPPESSQALLEHLEQANLFVVPLDNKRGWYRYHHMFADLLRFRLRREAGEQGLEPLHVQASKWYERNGLVAEAIHHALAAKDYERAMCLVEASARRMFMRSELATVLRWVDALPADQVRARPWLCIYAAWSLRLSGGQAQDVEAWLQVSEQAIAAAERVPAAADQAPAAADQAPAATERAPAAAERATKSPFSLDEIRTMRGHIATIRAYQALYREQIPRALELARQALEDLLR